MFKAVTNKMLRKFIHSYGWLFEFDLNRCMLSGKMYMEEDMLFAKIVSHKFDFSKLRLINGQFFNKHLQVLTTMSMYNQFCCIFKISFGVCMKHNQRLNHFENFQEIIRIGNTERFLIASKKTFPLLKAKNHLFMTHSFILI